MYIYSHILQEKRIIFSSKQMSTFKIAHFVFACLEMVAPPLAGVLKWVYPFVTLNNLSFLDVKGFIAGTSNQIFEYRKDWYDLCCEIDNVKMTFSKQKDDTEYLNPEEEPWFDLDQNFIYRIIKRIK